MCMMSKLTTQGSSQNRPFKPKIYQGKRRGQVRNYYRYGSNNADRRMSIEVELSMDKTKEEGHSMIKII